MHSLDLILNKTMSDWILALLSFNLNFMFDRNWSQTSKNYRIFILATRKHGINKM